MINVFSALLGRLTLNDFKHDLIVTGGQVTMVLSLLAIAGFLTFKKRWKWLWSEWLTSLDPKRIGIMYIVVSLIMLLRGFADALMMRGQQALGSGAGSGFLSSDHFQQVFTAHGTLMIFFVAMGLMFGIINLILPQQLGNRDVAFPFLNSMSFWLFVAGMVLINTSLIIGEFSAAGWLAYPPLSGIKFSPGVGVDYWLWSLQIAGLGSLLSGINFLVTIFKMRAKGMTMMKMPIFAWSVLGSMVLVAFSFPILTATLFMLFLDRYAGMHFFTSELGGDPMLYVNLIWAWGHPEVYILILPAFGVFSEIVPVFSRKKLFGYTSMVWAIIAITFLSFVVWLHHFFTMGAGANVNAFFGIMTMIIAVPTGVKVFNWLFTMYKGRIRFTSPMIWFLGFIATFTLGGVAGVIMAVPPADFQLHNSLFLVAHFHTMIIGGVVFGFMAALNYWFPKIFGFTLNDKLGKIAAYLWIAGFLVAFTPLYILGLMGATRRLDHYDPSLGWQGLFVVAAFGVVLIGCGVAVQVLQLIVSLKNRKKNHDKSGDPWDGRTLEWATPSPTPFYVFSKLPEVNDRDALWAAKKIKTKPINGYEDIYLPKNSPAGIIIAAFAFMIGFGFIWHITWLIIIGFLGAIVTATIRLTNDNFEEKITAETIKKLESNRTKVAA